MLHARLKTATAICLCALAMPLTAQAQDAGEQEDDDINTFEMEEMRVTAQRREQNIQDVPFAISAFSDEALDNRQVEETLDLIRYIPNAIAQNNTGLGTANTYYFRALGSTESIASFEPPVGTYVDDIYISRQIANNVALFDVERVEVLRGPQGTLFGRNTTGGAVSVIMKKPAEEFGASAFVSYGRFDRVTAGGAIDLPINDKVLTKIQGYYLDDNGFATSVATGESNLNDQDGFGVRGAVRVLPTDDLTWDVSVQYSEDNHANVANFVNPDGNGRLAQTGVSVEPGAISSLGFTGPKGDFGQGNLVEQFTFVSNIQYQLPFFDNVGVEIITGFIDTVQEFAIDFPLAPIPISTPPVGAFLISQQSDHQQFTQELKFAGSFLDGAVDFVSGFYFLNEDNFTDLGDAIFGTVFADRQIENDTTSWALYTQYDWHVTDKLTLTAGVRYTDEEKTLDVAGGFLNFGPAGPSFDPFTTEAIAAAGNDTELNVEVFTPRFVANYEATENLSVFASATRGFKSGAWSARALSPDIFVDVDPEFAWSFEGGLRSSWINDRLIFNATFFYIDLDAYQIPAAIDGAFVTDNFADLENIGVEIDAQFQATEGFNIYGSLGVQDARYLDPLQPLLDASLLPDGAIPEPTRAPNLTWLLGFTHEVEVPKIGGTFVTNASVQYIGEQTVQVGNGPDSFADNVLYVNAGISYITPDGRWTLTGECDNCTGQEEPVAVIVVPYINDPARWTVSLAYRF